MKNYKIYAISICLLLSMSCCSSSAKTPDTVEHHAETMNNKDEFDMLIDNAIDNGALPGTIEMQKPSSFELLLRKVAIMMILRPYIFLITTYRAVKEYLTQHLQNLLEKLKITHTDKESSEQKETE